MAATAGRNGCRQPATTVPVRVGQWCAMRCTVTTRGGSAMRCMQWLAPSSSVHTTDAALPLPLVPRRCRPALPPSPSPDSHRIASYPLTTTTDSLTHSTNTRPSSTLGTTRPTPADRIELNRLVPIRSRSRSAHHRPPWSARPLQPAARLHCMAHPCAVCNDQQCALDG